MNEHDYEQFEQAKVDIRKEFDRHNTDTCFRVISSHQVYAVLRHRYDDLWEEIKCLTHRGHTRYLRERLEHLAVTATRFNVALDGTDNAVELVFGELDRIARTSEPHIRVFTDVYDAYGLLEQNLCAFWDLVRGTDADRDAQRAVISTLIVRALFAMADLCPTTAGQHSKRNQDLRKAA